MILLVCAGMMEIVEVDKSFHSKNQVRTGINSTAPLQQYHYL